MSKIKLKKLSLNKEVIAKLHDSQMLGVRGGAGMSKKDSCKKGTCNGTCNGNSCCDDNEM